MKKRIRFEGSSLGSRDPDYQGRLRDPLWKDLSKFENRTFKFFTENAMSLEKIVDAHLSMETNKTKGNSSVPLTSETIYLRSRKDDSTFLACM